MSYDGWIEFGGVELVNLSRTAQLAEALGIPQVWTRPEDVDWIQTLLGGTDYDNVTEAPWYDAGYPASAEFAGLVPLAFPGLGDSTLTANVVEYITDGGNTGRARNATLSIVASVAIVASTDRGAEYGKRWMDRVLTGSGASSVCNGSVLRYFRFVDAAAPIAHHRDVRITRGSSITRKTRRDCSVTWMATFTLTAGDAFEYGEIQESIAGLGSETVTGPGLVSDGDIVLIETPCPVYDYTPIFDPLYPALVASPTAPDFYPAGWMIADGESFQRYWAIVDPIEPASLPVVPIITLTTPTEGRTIRVSVWPGDALVTEQCDPLFSAVVSYLPGGADDEFVIDGEQHASYVWNGLTARRADSLVYAPDARPVDWTSFSSDGGLLVTLDLFGDSDFPVAEVEMALALMSKSE